MSLIHRVKGPDPTRTHLYDLMQISDFKGEWGATTRFSYQTQQVERKGNSQLEIKSTRYLK